jgi:predicted nucleotidyltransferase
MNIVGILAEYKPFHNGQFFHLNKAKESAKAEYSVAVISSNFVQRGEPSIFTKWQRSEMAVRNGVDLVLELPVLYSSRSAYHFAFGSVYSLDKTNVITHLAFGSENPDLEELEKISSFLAEECDEFKIALKGYLNKGLSFPSSREKAIKDFFPEITTDLNQPNIILGLNYLKVLKELKSRIQPLPIQRIGKYHGLTPVENIAGATLIRNLIKENPMNTEDI